MPNPYERLPQTAFWRSAVAQRHPLAIDDLWASKFPITPRDQIVTAGSCFAQNIGRELVRAGYHWLDAEPAPPKLSTTHRHTFNYGVFSFRTGNIYSALLLRQWLQWASGMQPPSREVWVHEGRYYDPFRPAIEPDGFASEAELFAMRNVTLKAIRDAVTRADLLIFTLGLTEMWVSAAEGYVYPLCPGTAAGTFDPRRHVFRNGTYPEVLDDLNASFDLIRSLNGAIRILLTVSPVPMTATASRDHVLVANTQMKATLRAVAGDLARTAADVDYFPSYDIITGVPFRGMFYDPNMRSVSRHGVDVVMRAFFAGLRRPGEGSPDAAVALGGRAEPSLPGAASDPEDDLVCEERLLEAFGRGAR